MSIECFLVLENCQNLSAVGLCVFLLLYHFEPFIIELVYVQTTLACYLTENDHYSYVVLIASLR